MRRDPFPVGQTILAMPKALARYLDTHRGAAVTEQWLRDSRLAREQLQDETQAIPVSALRDALIAFVQVAGRDAIVASAPELVASDNLGPWVRILRGLDGPEQAFGRLDGAESEYGRSTRWETLEARSGLWRGRVLIAHDPALEEDGLLTLARAALLRSVPLLFGFDVGSVVARGTVTDASASLAQSYEVRWSVPGAWASSAAGALAGALAGSGAFLGTHTSLGWLPVPILLGAASGRVVVRERLRRIHGHAQEFRVRALERGLVLKELAERAAHSGGTLVAGQYRIEQRVGSGASGVIFEATRVRDGLPVALKLLRAAAAHDVIASDRLRREAEALRLAWHPNVVELLDQGYLPDGTSYMVMERLRGETLSARLRTRGTLTEEETRSIGLQVCKALDAVHAAGVVHRDIKPANIFLVRAEDGTERVKIIDFGLARVEWEETRITNSGAPVGTPGYMSPEQETGGEVGAPSDLFALGVVLYECLLGELPPPMPSGMWLARSANSSVPKDRRMDGARVAAAWRGVLDRAMAAAPRDRFADARMFATALNDTRKAIGGGASTEGGAGAV